MSHRTPSFRPRLEGLEHRLTPSATNLWDGAVNVPPDEAYAEAAETLTVSDSPLPPVIASDEASGQEPLELGVAQPADVDTQVMGRNADEIFSAQATNRPMEPGDEELRDDGYADSEDASLPLEYLGGEPIDFALTSP